MQESPYTSIGEVGQSKNHSPISNAWILAAGGIHLLCTVLITVLLCVQLPRMFSKLERQGLPFPSELLFWDRQTYTITNCYVFVLLSLAILVFAGGLLRRFVNLRLGEFGLVMAFLSVFLTAAIVWRLLLHGGWLLLG